MAISSQSAGTIDAKSWLLSNGTRLAICSDLLLLTHTQTPTHTHTPPTPTHVGIHWASSSLCMPNTSYHTQKKHFGILSVTAAQMLMAAGAGTSQKRLLFSMQMKAAPLDGTAALSRKSLPARFTWMERKGNLCVFFPFHLILCSLVWEEWHNKLMPAARVLEGYEKKINICISPLTTAARKSANKIYHYLIK